MPVFCIFTDKLELNIRCDYPREFETTQAILHGKVLFPPLPNQALQTHIVLSASDSSQILCSKLRVCPIPTTNNMNEGDSL